MGVVFRFNDAAAGRIERAAGHGVRAAGQHLRGAAADRAPVETGVLRNSAKVQVDGDTAAVSFNTPYAAVQHENVGFAHPGGGEAKFLENAMNDESTTIKDIIAEHVRRAL